MASSLALSRWQMALVILPPLLLISTPTAAQDKSTEGYYLNSLKSCQSEKDPAARLACFDAATANLVAANEAGDLRIVDRDEVKKTRRRLFGFALPDLGIFGKRGSAEDKEEEFDEIDTSIAAVSGAHGRGYVIRTEEGALWRIDEVPRRLLEPRVGDKLLIKSGALSAFFIRINNQSGVKAVRIR